MWDRGLNSLSLQPKSPELSCQRTAGLGAEQPPAPAGRAPPPRGATHASPAPSVSSPFRRGTPQGRGIELPTVKGGRSKEVDEGTEHVRSNKRVFKTVT